MKASMESENRRRAAPLSLIGPKSQERWLVVSFALVALTGIALFLIVLRYTGSLMRDSEALVGNSIPSLETISGLKRSIAEQEPILYRYYATRDLELFRRQFGESRAEIERGLAELHRLHGLSENGKCHLGLATIVKLADELVAALNGAEPDWDRARELLGKASVTSQSMLEGIDGMVGQVRTQYEKNLAETQRAISLESYVVYGFASMLFILGTLAAIYLRRYFGALSFQSTIALFPERNPAPVMRLSLDGKITYANPATVAALETLESGKKHADPGALLPADLASRLAALVQNDVRSENWEYPVGERHFRCVTHFLPEAGVFHAYPLDITEQHFAERELANAMNQIRDLSRKLADENVYLREEVKAANTSTDIIGQSAPLLAALHRVDQVAGTDATVLILGESGVGKESMARAVHDRGARGGGPFIKINCASIPASLVESELFGHERGAFTGALQRRLGRFELADGGSLFLDEVGELPLDTQAKLLRVLQEREFERVGGSATVRANVRVIAATNRDLERMVSEGRFREDLFYRINVFPIEIPPLRDRREDIPLLAAHFLRRFARQHGKSFDGVSARAMTNLQEYDWPGNIRELQNVIERASILSSGKILEVPPMQKQAHSIDGGSGLRTLVEHERLHILNVLNEAGWKIEGKLGAAARLGMPPGTLRSRMKKLAIERPRILN